MPTPTVTLALADTAATLDPEHPVNASLRERGIGFSARVREVSLPERYAVVGASAIMAFFRVPLGWFCIDDGRRALVFDPDEEIQVNLSLRTHTGDLRALLQQVVDEALSQQADLDARFIELGGHPMLALGNLRIESEVLKQVYWPLRLRAPDGSQPLVMARVTASDAHIERALNLAEVIMTSLHIPGV